MELPSLLSKQSSDLISFSFFKDSQDQLNASDRGNQNIELLKIKFAFLSFIMMHEKSTLKFNSNYLLQPSKHRYALVEENAGIVYYYSFLFYLTTILEICWKTAECCGKHIFQAITIHAEIFSFPERYSTSWCMLYSRKIHLYTYTILMPASQVSFHFPASIDYHK